MKRAWRHSGPTNPPRRGPGSQIRDRHTEAAPRLISTGSSRVCKDPSAPEELFSEAGLCQQGQVPGDKPWVPVQESHTAA